MTYDPRRFPVFCRRIERIPGGEDAPECLVFEAGTYSLAQRLEGGSPMSTIERRATAHGVSDCRFSGILIVICISDSRSTARPPRTERGARKPAPVLHCLVMHRFLLEVPGSRLVCRSWRFDPSTMERCHALCGSRVSASTRSESRLCESRRLYGHVVVRSDRL